MLMSAFLLRFKANYLEKLLGYPYFSLWIPIALAKIYFFGVVLTWRKNLLVGTVLKLYKIIFDSTDSLPELIKIQGWRCFLVIVVNKVP